MIKDIQGLREQAEIYRQNLKSEYLMTGREGVLQDLENYLAQINEYKRRIQLWVDALRSGNYTQAFGKLKVISREGLGEQDGHCCLGVACEVARLNGLRLVSEQRQYSNMVAEAFNGNPDYMPNEVVEWLGLGDGNPEFRWTWNHEGSLRYGSWSLSKFNDHQFSFAQIADMIAWYYGLHKADTVESEL